MTTGMVAALPVVAAWGWFIWSIHHGDSWRAEINRRSEEKCAAAIRRDGRQHATFHSEMRAELAVLRAEMAQLRTDVGEEFRVACSDIGVVRREANDGRITVARLEGSRVHKSACWSQERTATPPPQFRLGFRSTACA